MFVRPSPDEYESPAASHEMGPADEVDWAMPDAKGEIAANNTRIPTSVIRREERIDSIYLRLVSAMVSKASTDVAICRSTDSLPSLSPRIIREIGAAELIEA